MSEEALVPVEIGVCPCPGTPHPDGDTVYLHPKAGLNLGLAVSGALAGEDSLDRAVLLGNAYLRYGIADWTFVDAKNQTIPVTRGSIQALLPWGGGGRLVADRADTLYYDEAVSPLVEKALAQLSRGQNNGSTSQSPPSGRTPRKSSKSSLPRDSAGTTVLRAIGG